MQTDNTVKLKVNGKIFQGWLSVEITSSLQSLARTFAVSATRSRSASGDLTDGISAGDAVEVFIGDDKVLTGYVMKKTVSYSSSSVIVEISGASRPIDLMQCMMPDGYPLSYKNQMHLQNLQSVCKPYGIEVVDEVGNTKKCDFEIKPADTIGQTVIDYLKKHGLLICDDEEGRLVICKACSAGKTYDGIVVGVNVLSGNKTEDWANLFSDYVALGQASNPNSDLPTTANQLKASVLFSRVGRPRTYVKQVSGNASQESLRKKVISFRDVSVGEAESLEYTLTGWRQKNGELWQVNKITSVTDIYLGINADRLISRVKLSLSGTGMTTAITLRRRESYNVFEIEKDSEAKATDFDNVVSDSGKTGESQWTKS